MIRLLALVWPELRAPEADVAPFERMLDALDDLSPRVEAVDTGVALVDVTGLGPMWGTERRIAARAVMQVRAVAPLAVRCGIGDNRWLATLAARLARFERPEAPAAFRTLERDELPGLPLTMLPADAAMRQRFALFGLTEMRQLADLPRSAVGSQFGPAGEWLQALARGHDPRPLVPRRRPARVEADATFDPPLDGIGAVGLTLRRLSSDLCDRLGERHLAPGRAVLTLCLEDAPAIRVAQPFPQPVLEPDWIARLLLSRLEAEVRRRADRVSPNAHHTSVTHGSLPLNGSFASKGLRKTLQNAARESRNGADPAPKAHHTSIWQERAQNDRGDEPDEPDEPEDREEPRVASVHLALDRLSDPATRQLPAFEARAGRWEELRWSLERIRHRFGAGRLWRATVERPTAALSEHRSRLVDIGG